MPILCLIVTIRSGELCTKWTVGSWNAKKKTHMLECKSWGTWGPSFLNPPQKNIFKLPLWNFTHFAIIFIRKLNTHTHNEEYYLIF